MVGQGFRAPADAALSEMAICQVSVFTPVQRAGVWVSRRGTDLGGRVRVLGHVEPGLS